MSPARLAPGSSVSFLGIRTEKQGTSDRNRALTDHGPLTLEENLMRHRPKILLRLLVLLGCVAGACAFCSSLATEAPRSGFIRVTPEELDWKPVAGGHGIALAVVSGNPSQPGIYVIRVRFPAGIMSSPHFHGEDRHVVVLQGIWYTGTDDSWDPARTVGLPAGSYMKHPAGAVHYDGAKDEEVIVQIVGMGPSSTTVLFPSEGDFGTPHKLN